MFYICHITYVIVVDDLVTQGSMTSDAMGLLPDTQTCGLRMRRECRESFPRHRGLAIPTCITARASRTCRDACWNRQLAVSFEIGGGENVPGIPGAYATHPLRIWQEAHGIELPTSAPGGLTLYVLNFSK